MKTTEKIQTYICYKFSFMVLLEKGAFELPHSQTPQLNFLQELSQ